MIYYSFTLYSCRKAFVLQVYDAMQQALIDHVTFSLYKTMLKVYMNIKKSKARFVGVVWAELLLTTSKCNALHHIILFRTPKMPLQDRHVTL